MAVLSHTAHLPQESDVEPQEYDEIIRNLVRIATHQDTINERLTGAIERLTGAIERLDTTQARIEALLQRMLPTTENGRDA